MSDKNNVVDMIANELTYLPSAEQRRIKSAFWAKFLDNPLCEPSDISLSIVAQFVGDSRIQRWWSVAGFREWFCNRDEFRQRIENLAYKCLERMESLLDDPNTNANAVVNTMKLIMEMGKKMPSKSSKELYLDEKVAEMSKAELESYIQKNTKLISKAE